MAYPAAVQFGDRRADALAAAVAAMVVGQHGNVHTGVAQGIGQCRRRPEQRVARVASPAGEGCFEIHDREVARIRGARAAKTGW